MNRNKLIFVIVAFLITLGIVFALPKFFSERDDETTESPNEQITAKLGETFELALNQVATIPISVKDGYSVRLKVTEFYYQPCDEGRQCFWSGLDVYYELIVTDVDGIAIYMHPGNIIEAPYNVSLLKSDYKTKATFIVDLKDLPKTTQR